MTEFYSDFKVDFLRGYRLTGYSSQRKGVCNETHIGRYSTIEAVAERIVVMEQPRLVSSASTTIFTSQTPRRHIKLVRGATFVKEQNKPGVRALTKREMENLTNEINAILRGKDRIQ